MVLGSVRWLWPYWPSAMSAPILRPAQRPDFDGLRERTIVVREGQATDMATGPYSASGSLTGATKVTAVNVDTAPAGGMGGRR